MSLTGQLVWVLGAGFLGRVLATRCREAGARVLSIDVAPEAGADICADAAAPGVLAGLEQPAAVFCSLATRGGTVEDYRHCYLDTMCALSAAQLAGRCVFCSSTSLYAGVSERSAVLTEAEKIVLQAGGCVARLAPLYGEGRCELLRRHLVGEPRLPGPPERVLNYVHVEDAAAALFLLAEQAASGVYAVCGESFTKEHAYRELSRITGVPAATADAPQGKRNITMAPIDSTTMRALGWAPRHNLLQEAATMRLS
ncbi:MAG: hypothetical protein II295_08355 [Akkermansia sp.]|nr:hypothetical protein [Akkermansia sp.]